MKTEPHIPLYANLNNHPKLLRLYQGLQLHTDDEKLLIRAKLENLWLWAIQYYPDGVLRDITSDEIAMICGWKDEPIHWLNALRYAEFIEITEMGVELINWDQYGGKSLKKKQQDAIRKQRSRSKQQNNDSQEIPQENQSTNNSDSMSHGHPRDNTINDNENCADNELSEQHQDSENPKVESILQLWHLKEKFKSRKTRSLLNFNHPRDVKLRKPPNRKRSKKHKRLKHIAA
jgi:hypothetical protein